MAWKSGEGEQNEFASVSLVSDDNVLCRILRSVFGAI